PQPPSSKAAATSNGANTRNIRLFLMAKGIRCGFRAAAPKITGGVVRGVSQFGGAHLLCAQ
ncbi:MAG TPA: hypothetical protein PK760_16685, partial [Flavobacteriales bacterium]|nr:hypothetical protein [Flavobacteriales bacterium]